jgi:hypothetical protein
VDGTVLILAPSDAILPDLKDGDRAVTTRRFASSAELAAALDDSVQAVVVHAASVNSADWDWVAARLAEGRVVAGIDLHMRDLQRLVRDESAGDFGQMTLSEGFVAALVGGAGSPCSAGVYSQTDLVTALKATLSCANSQFR